jgi:hypothetical protein
MTLKMAQIQIVQKEDIWHSMTSFTTNAIQAADDSSSPTPLRTVEATHRPPRSSSARSGKALIPEEFYNLCDEESERWLGAGPLCDLDTEAESSLHSSTSSARASFILQASTTELAELDRVAVENDTDSVPLSKPDRAASSKPSRSDSLVVDRFKPAKLSGMPLRWPVSLPGDKLFKNHPNPRVRSLFRE